MEKLNLSHPSFSIQRNRLSVKIYTIFTDKYNLYAVFLKN